MSLSRSCRCKQATGRGGRRERRRTGRTSRDRRQCCSGGRGCVTVGCDDDTQWGSSIAVQRDSRPMLPLRPLPQQIKAEAMTTSGGGKRPDRRALRTHRIDPSPSLDSAGQREVENAKKRTATNQVDSSWASLHVDVLEMIADRVLAGDLLDYIWFRASCKTWRAATPCPLGRGVVDPRFHPRQWTMFPEGSGLHPGHPALGDYIRFLNINTGILIRVHLLAFKDHSVLDCPDGLLLLQRNKDASICLLHPLTGDVAKFPPLASLCLYMNKFGIYLNGPYDLRLRMVHAAVSVNAGATVTIMLTLSHLERMAYVSTGDRQWTHTSWLMSGMRTAVPFRGSLYVVKGSKPEPWHIMRVDPPDSSSASSWLFTPPQIVATCSADQMTKPYLVECNSELLVVGFTNGHSRHVVLRLADLLLGVPAVPLTSIGDHTLFIGTWSIAVNSKNLPSIQGNSITVLNPSKSGRLRQYDLGRGTWSAVCDGDFLGASGPVPRPYSLVHHIVSCSQRLFWISGQIWSRHHNSDPCWPRVAGAHVRDCTICTDQLKLVCQSNVYI